MAAGTLGEREYSSSATAYFTDYTEEQLQHHKMRQSDLSPCETSTTEQ